MAPEFSKDLLEEIRSRCDIADLIGGFGVQLKRSGSGTFKGLCPFHQEKTPSFHVNTARQTYHCFGCGKGGDVFRFFMDKENVDFPNAVQILASRCGVIIPERSERESAVAGERKSVRERLYAVNEEFSRFFCRYLRDNPNSSAGEYLRRRGIPGDIAERFRIGAAPDSWTACRDYGRQLGFSDDELVSSGVVRRRDDGGNCFDQFKGRLTFTIENEQGRAVGFSARTLEAKPVDGRKYVNTPETPVFHKGSLLYALPLARQAIGKNGCAVLCEGQLDAIAFHRAGFEFALAPLGTAFTPEQARILKRYTNSVILSFDADAAGQKAVLRAAEILLPLSMELKVLRIPGGKDPDELYANGGVTALKSALDSAFPWLTVLGAALPERFDLETPIGRGQAAAFVAEYLRLVDNQVELEVYVHDAAAMLRVSEDALYAELSKSRRHLQRRQEFAGGRDLPPPAVPPAVVDPALPALSTLLELAFMSVDIGRELSELLEPGEIGNASPVEKALNMAINAALNGEHDQLASELNNLLLESPSSEISRILVEPETYADPGKALGESLAMLRRLRRESAMHTLMSKLRTASTADEKSEILREIQHLGARAQRV